MKFRNGSYYIYNPLGIVVRVTNALVLNSGWEAFARVMGENNNVFDVPVDSLRLMTSSEFESYRAHRNALKG
jgi:hypothetical protein